jgi:hypothetical protein
MSRRDELYEIEHCTIMAETDQAIKVALSDGETMWLPLSQVEEIHRSKQLNEDRLVVTRWIARQKGLV